MTPAQLTTLKAAIVANATWNAFPFNTDGAFAIAKLLNVTASPVQNMWRTNVPVADVFDAIDWTKYTPADVADTTAIFLNRCAVINVKQMNLQNMLIGRDRIDASKLNIRAGLRDAVIALPAGAAGAAVSAGGAGGVTVLTACVRLATEVEKILRGADATTGTVTAALPIFEGIVSYNDVEAARNS